MKNYKLDIRKIKKGCIVKMKASSGIKGYGNHQCISEQHGTLNTISLYGHNQHYDVHDILEIIDSPFFTLEQQQADIEFWKNKLAITCVNFEGYVDDKQAEIEKLKNLINKDADCIARQQIEIEHLKKDSELDTDNLIKHLTNELYYGDYEEYDDGEKTCYKYIDKNEINGRIKEAFKSLPKPPEGES